jgi:hypothetical protein
METGLGNEARSEWVKEGYQRTMDKSRKMRRRVKFEYINDMVVVRLYWKDENEATA